VYGFKLKGKETDNGGEGRELPKKAELEGRWK
jgi:hypothetical protein